MNCQNSRCFRPSLVHEMILRQLPLPEHFQSFLRLFDQRIYSHHLDRQILSPLTCKVLRQRESYSSIMSIARSFGFGRACPSETMESVPTCRWTELPLCSFPTPQRGVRTHHVYPPRIQLFHDSKRHQSKGQTDRQRWRPMQASGESRERLTQWSLEDSQKPR